jgi:superoxide dismutase
VRLRTVVPQKVWPTEQPIPDCRDILIEQTLPKLPYAQDALAPHLSLDTLQYHYGKHHQAYVDKFHNLFLALAVGNFGSGWTWLVTKCDGSLGELAIRSQELRIAPSGNAKRPCPARAAGPAARRRAWAREAPGEAGR